MKTNETLPTAKFIVIFANTKNPEFGIVVSYHADRDAALRMAIQDCLNNRDWFLLDFNWEQAIKMVLKGNLEGALTEFERATNGNFVFNIFSLESYVLGKTSTSNVLQTQAELLLKQHKE